MFFLPFSFGKWRSPLQRIRNNVEKGTVGKREIETIDNDQKGYGAVSLIHYVHWLKKKNRLISNSYCIETKHKHTAVSSHHWCLHEHQIQFHSIYRFISFWMLTIKDLASHWSVCIKTYIVFLSNRKWCDIVSVSVFFHDYFLFTFNGSDRCSQAYRWKGQFLTSENQNYYQNNWREQNCYDYPIKSQWFFRTKMHLVRNAAFQMHTIFFSGLVHFFLSCCMASKMKTNFNINNQHHYNWWLRLRYATYYYDTH